MYIQNYQDNVSQEENFTIPYQSQLTNLMAQEILKTGNCSLPSYNESMQLHKELLNTFIKHLQKNNKDEVTVCPIT